MSNRFELDGAARNMPLFSGTAMCARCRDHGVWLTPQSRVELCPRIQCGDEHPELSAGARLIERAGRSLLFRKIDAGFLAFSLACDLARFTSGEPCSRQDLIDRHFAGFGASSLRHFHYTIEELRSVWLLPVGSRKSTPHGYWMITSEADYKEWFDRTTQSPITQLSTLHRNAKANFPVFAEQIELEFWKDAGDELPVAA